MFFKIKSAPDEKKCENASDGLVLINLFIFNVINELKYVVP